MIKISFILPCYNVEPYIGRCLDSILHQDMPLDEYEIICVNDCSPDNLRGVVIDYQQRYPNVRLIEHVENKTSGGARNTGIEAATGEYLWFVDPDDMIEENCLKFFYDTSFTVRADILVFNYRVSNIIGECRTCDVVNDNKIGLDGISFVSEMFPNKRLAGISSVWHAFFRREFCIQNNIRFPEIKSSQDVVFLWKCFINAKVVLSTRSYGYTLYERSDSMTGSKGKLKANAVFSATILYTNELLNMLEDYSEKIPSLFKEDILREIQLSLDDDSRKVLQSSIYQKLCFYKLLLPNDIKIDRLNSFMNDNTKHIFNYKSSFGSWLLFVEWFRIKRMINHLWKA